MLLKLNTSEELNEHSHIYKEINEYLNPFTAMTSFENNP